MNKQELINKLKFQLTTSSGLDSADFDEGYNYAIKYAIASILLLDDTTNNTTIPTHYQGTIQPIDLINAQDLNFNLGNVVKYVCRAGKKQGENILSDLEKAKDYINFEIERVKQ